MSVRQALSCRFRRARLPRLLLPMVMAAACALRGQESAGQAGFDSRRVTPSLTRAELLRKWDLDSDGKLDAGEVEVAMSKMRLQRAEMRLNASLDPVTGKPRINQQMNDDAAELDAAALPDAEMFDAEEAGKPRPMTVDELAEKLGFTPRDEATEMVIPREAAGTDSVKNPAGAVGPPPRMFGLPPLRGQPPGSTAGRPARTGAGQTSDPLAPAVPQTGGVRAGAAAARPGYGSGLAPPSLNAGRPFATAGGLVPRLQAPAPATSPSAALPRTPGAISPGSQPPAPPPPPRPRRTVEDFEVYR